jgi:hypothetical protein
MSTMLETVDEPSALAKLSGTMRNIARRFISARTRAGEAMLDAARALAAARRTAKHGEWGLFLAATNTSEGTAKRWLDIHEAAENDARFADALKIGHITFTVAAELAQPSTPPALIEAVLTSEKPSTVTEVRAAKREAALNNPPRFPDELRRAIVAVGADIGAGNLIYAPVGFDEEDRVYDEAGAWAAVERWRVSSAAPVQEAAPIEGIEERLGRAMEQTAYLLRLLEATDWTGARHACRLLARTMEVME